MIRCLLVDDHPVVRAGYCRLLEQSGRISVAGEAGDAESGYAEYRRLSPEVTVTDISLPGASGLELIRRVRARDHGAALLVFTMHETPILAEGAFAAGALGFVSKRSAPAVLVDAVLAVHAGRRYLSADVAAAMQSSGALTDAARLASLSPRELEVFRLLAAGASPAECARAVNLSAKTIANYQTLIKDKLGVETTAAMAHVALRHGLIGGRPAPA
jgi:DNA-binding NarL/FixJ family response regulator